MTEKCPYCGKEFVNSKALGSHVHYAHENLAVQQNRTAEEQERFRRLLGSCFSDAGLPRPRGVERIGEAINVIPEGVSADLDKFRSAFKCALSKEKLLKEVEEMIRESSRKEEK